ncbi:MAG: hypothetical protein DRR08_21450 [Candidatus Parabeggiatoa sp. nov. 2]|nr:MAG: hypothetical protein DRR08_21450 [Gammaproteobacteria bacterium]
MTQLPIRKLTLYKQGIGYFERRGQVNGTSLSLIVPRENLNDTLKSLSIIDRHGKPVLSVDYETPADTVLDELSIKLTDRSSMVDLLQSLRGSHITLRLESKQTATGRLIGVETSLEPSTHTATVLLQDGNDPSNIRLYSIAKVLGLSLHDERAATDVSFFLDVSQTEQTRSALMIRLSEGEHDLEIGYLAPSPTWRVSYQLVSEGQNQARLLGWGLFDNRLDEDLENVILTLKSGRPISFKYNLYESYVPSRPQVSDDPMALEAISDNPLVVESVTNISHELRTPLSAILGISELLQEEFYGPLNVKQKKSLRTASESGQHLLKLINDLLDMVRLREKGQAHTDYSTAFLSRSGPLGDLKVSNAYFKPMLIGNAEPEFLTYEVETPVSVRRKQSAMVPIIDHSIAYQEICVYNGDKMPNHPLRVWCLRNSTGKALEQGPVTFIKEGQYLGEGLMRFTGVGDELHLPYALEFGIVVSETSERGLQNPFQVEFDSKKRRAVVKRYEVTEYIYTLTSHVKRETTVYIERRDPNQGEYYQMQEPDLAMAGHTRWSVTVPANGDTSFTVQIRTVHKREEDITRWKTDFVKEIRADGLLDDEIYAKFENHWIEQQQESATSNQVKVLEAEYKQLLSRQQQLRENIGALSNPSEREAEIRNRILDDLETSENRRRELETEIATLTEQVKQLQRTQQTLRDEIYGLE